MGVVKVTLNDDTLIDITDTTVVASEMFQSKVATGVDGEKMTGTYVAPASKTAADVTVSGATVTIPAGAYASQVQKSVATTTHPAPTASINSSTGLVTASHTQGTGYVTGGTTTGTLQLGVQAAKTVTPTESEQTAVAAHRYTTGEVKVGAISSTYVGSGITQRDSDDLTANGATITAPAGYYSASASKSVESGVLNDPFISLAPNLGLITATTIVGSSGYLEELTETSSMYQLPSLAATTYTPTESAQTIASRQWLTGTQTIAGISSKYIGTGVARKSSANLSFDTATLPPKVIAPSGYYENSAVYSLSTIEHKAPTISFNSATGAITASHSTSSGYMATAGTVYATPVQLSSRAASSYTPGTANQVIPSATYLTGNQTILGDANLKASNIASGVSIFGVVGTFEGGIVPSGTYTVSSDGTYNISSYASVEVATNVNLYKDFFERNAIYTSATRYNIEAMTSIDTILAGQFAYRVFSGSIVFGQVSSIQANAFERINYGRGNTYSLYFPECTYIGQYAFEGASKLTFISFPKCTLIDTGAFVQTPLASADFPKCENIYSFAFSGCTALSSIELSACLSIGASAFTGCSFLTYVSIPSCMSIDNYAFNSCKSLPQISAPNCIKLGYAAFSGCTKLQSAYFSVLTSISAAAFMYTSALSDIYFPECTYIGASAFQYAIALSVVLFPKCTTVSGQAFYGCNELTSVSLPLCTFISDRAFSGCYKLQLIDLPECETIGDSVFYGCASLSSVSIPNCNTIRKDAFRSCTNALTSVSLPALSVIYSYAFGNCSKLESVYIFTSAVPQMSATGQAFYQTPIGNSTYLGYFGSIYVRASLADSFKRATYWTTYSSRIVGLTDEEIAALDAS